MDIPNMENIEPDSTGIVFAQHSQLTYPEPHGGVTEEHMGLNAFFAQEVSLKGECSVVQAAGCKQTCTMTNGIYVGPGMKEIAGTVGASDSAYLTMSSELQSTEGPAKDLSAFLGSSYSTVFSDSLGSIFTETRSPNLTVPTWHKQRPMLYQRPQNLQIRDTEALKEILPQAPLRVVRPPGEGRGKNQMLPRYWPRFTDQELRLLATKDSNSTITPLFEKVLSASDAGKIGRLVLPKACAEAYFPPISQAEGVPLIVQDITGKEWVFQFRFWPNNNSRMYVLEGITPCIQSMNLQAGDTVIFSRIDPEGKLVMGYRRAPNLSSAEENPKPLASGSNMTASSRLVSPGSTDKISTITSLTKLLMQTEENLSKAQLSRRLGQFNVRVADNGYKLFKLEKLGPQMQEGSHTDLHIIGEKRKSKEVSTKSKKQQLGADKNEFRKNWEEAQSLLRSPPNVTPSIVTVEGYDFEEYEEPPVFGKDIAPAMFSACNSLEGDVQKDKAGSVLQHGKVIKKDACLLDAAVKKDIVAGPLKVPQPYSGLETLANVATTEGNNGESAASSSATTTKHPRHRPGCSCIVCIQPPSGKGPKHKPNCECNVCMTVKRRFQTLMLRRKKLQSERAAENAAQKNHQFLVTSMETNFGEREPGFHQSASWQGCMTSSYSNQIMDGLLNSNKIPSGYSSIGPHQGVSSDYEQLIASKGANLDLNSQPEREEEMNKSVFPVSMKKLLQSAGYPLDMYLKEQGLTSLVCRDQLQCPLAGPERSGFILKEEGHDYILPSNSDDLKVEPNYD